MNAGLLAGLKPKLLRLLRLTADPQADAGDLWFDSVLKVPKFHDGAAVQQLVPLSSIIEAVSRVLAIGHSHIAESGASNISYGSMHKFANLFPARFTNLSVGGAVAVLPDVYSPDQGTGVGTVKAGWGWVFDQIQNRQRTTGINTTIGAGGTSAGLAAGTSVLVGASAGAVIAIQPVMVGKGATAEITYIQTIPDATHVSFYDQLVNAHSAGDPVVAVPDSYLMPLQLSVVEFEWNDLIWMGPTAWGQAFIHCYRSIIARLRCACHWDADSALIRQTTGSWSITTPAVGFASGPKLISATVNGNALTLDIPVNFPAGAQLVLFFRTRANGDGALYTITIDGDGSHTVTYDTRNINGYFYSSGTGTRAANGVEMSSCYVIRGLAAGAHTIIVTATTIQGTADFMGFGIIPPDLPPMIVERPYRWYSYAGLPGTMYTPTDADQATMDTAIVNLLAEFTNPSSTVFGGTASPDTTLLNINKDAVIAKQKKFFSYDWVHTNDAGHAEIAVLLVNVISAAAISVRSLVIPAVADSVKSGAGWYPFGSAGGAATIKLGAGWANYASGTPAAYRKDIPSGMVHLRGEIQRTTDDFTVVNPAIAQLPVGHRPISEQQFVCHSYNGPVQVTISPAGVVTLAGVISNSNSGNSYLSLAGIQFVAEQ